MQRVQRAAAHVEEAFSGAGHRRSCASVAYNFSTKVSVARLGAGGENIITKARDRTSWLIKTYKTISETDESVLGLEECF